MRAVPCLVSPRASRVGVPAMSATGGRKTSRPLPPEDGVDWQTRCSSQHMAVVLTGAKLQVLALTAKCFRNRIEMVFLDLQNQGSAATFTPRNPGLDNVPGG